MLNTFRCPLLLVAVFFLTGKAWALSPDRIVVVANQADEHSMTIARHYMEKRAIPEKNLILLETTTGEDITWEEFLETMFNPLREKLHADGWIEGSLGDSYDFEGRRKLVTLGGRLDFLVLCRMPLRIKNDQPRVDRAPAKPPQKQFLVNQGSTDGELALLAAPNTPTVSFVPNPLFGQLRPPSMILQQVIKVARLDGPSVAATMALVDHAIEAEEKGLRGRAYIDLGGPHKKGNDWMQEAGELLEGQDFPVTWNRVPAAIDFTERFDAPAFYFGWWKVNVTGPPRERDFRFPPGALGWHLHSYSANSLRRNNYRWSGPLVQRGITATVGNVYEPYLELTHHPHAFVKALLAGMSAGEAAYYSLPALSWMAVFIGDPLYQPFTVSEEAQLEMMKKSAKPDDLAQYTVLREIERLKESLGLTPAIAYGEKEFNKAPGLALGYELALLNQQQGHVDEAVKSLAFASRLPPIFGANEQGLAYLSANLLWDLMAREDAFELMQSLMRSAIPDAARRAYLPTAISWARTLRKTGELAEWSAQQAEFEAQDRAREEEKKAKEQQKK